MSGIEFIFAIAILLMSVVVHEISHGYAAYFLGDPTAKYAGRLTLNPLNHLEFLGSFFIPLITYFLGGFIFGWAKPVPYNPYNLRDQKWGPAIVGLAGPLANILIAIFFGLILRFSSLFLFLPYSSFEIVKFIVFINLLLAVFNLIPIPPLDGSKLLFAFLPYQWDEVRYFLERYGIFLLVFVIIFIWPLLLPILSFLFKLITGFSIGLR